MAASASLHATRDAAARTRVLRVPELEGDVHDLRGLARVAEFLGPAPRRPEPRTPGLAVRS